MYCTVQLSYASVPQCYWHTFESRLSLHVLPRAVGTPGEADDDRGRLTVRCASDGSDRHQHGTDAEEHPSFHCAEGYKVAVCGGEEPGAMAFIGASALITHSSAASSMAESLWG